MQEHEFVTKKEYAPIKKKFEQIIVHAKNFFSNKYDTDFYYQLVGSGNRHLVTRIKNSNKGFDLDYNLVLPTLEDGWSYKANVIAEQIREALNRAVKGTEFKFPEGSTSVFTIKAVDKKKSKIKYSCDLAVVYYTNDVKCMQLKHDKNGRYSFKPRKCAEYAQDKLDYILEYENGWNCVRDEYLKLKNRNNDPHKHSFNLYWEAVNNVYEQFKQKEEEERSPQPQYATPSIIIYPDGYFYR